MVSQECQFDSWSLLQAFYFPVDPRLNFSMANRLLKELQVIENNGIKLLYLFLLIQPRQLIVPEVYISSTQENTLLPVGILAPLTLLYLNCFCVLHRKYLVK